MEHYVVIVKLVNSNFVMHISQLLGVTHIPNCLNSQIVLDLQNVHNILHEGLYFEKEAESNYLDLYWQEFIKVPNREQGVNTAIGTCGLDAETLTCRLLGVSRMCVEMTTPGLL